MKRTTTLFISLFTVLILMQSNTAGDYEKKPDEYNEKFENLKERIKTAAYNIEHHKAGEVFRLIQENIERFNDFAEITDTLSDKMNACEPMATELRAIASTYSNIAQLDNELESYRDDMLREIEDVNAISTTVFDNITSDRNILKAKLDSIKNELLFNPDDEYLQIDSAKYARLLSDMQKVYNMWQKFDNYIEELLVVLYANHEAISLLLYSLDANSEIFVSSAGTLDLACNMSNAFDELDGIVDVDITIENISNGWSKLDKIMEDIDDIELINEQ